MEVWVQNNDLKTFWSSSGIQQKLRKDGFEMMPSSPEIEDILNQDDPLPPTYDELAMVVRFEWDRKMRNEIRRPLVGEGHDGSLLPQAIQKA